MAILARIKLPDRSELKKIIRSKEKTFSWDGDDYNIDFQCSYISKIWLGWIKIVTLDYEKGCPDPVPYFLEDEQVKNRSKLRPDAVAQLIKKLLQEIPHFQMIAIILLIVACCACGAAAYFSWEAGSKAQAILDLLNQEVVNV